MNDLVSVIMPSYNTADYISSSIQSVLNQTYQNWELLIVDDCSTDNTDEIIQIFLKDKRIKYYKNTKNFGAAVSRNKALREAKGKWIAFLDSDDLWKPDKLMKQINFMEKNRYYFSYTNYSEISEEGDDLNLIITGPKKIDKIKFFYYCWPGCLTVMYDAQKIGLVQITDIKKNNDYAMWLKICRKTDCYLINENLALYRRKRTGSISNHDIKTMIAWHYRLFHESENMTPLFSVFYTIQNLIFGFYKKIIYVERKND